jgi:riboflavin kinase/FMN adenylyltransferase
MTSIVPFTKNLKVIKPSLPIVIGFFDGIHKGHLKLFKNLKKNKFNILTFVNVPGKYKNFVYDDNQRVNSLKSLFPNIIYVLDLNKNNMQTMAFVYHLRHYVKPTTIIIGSDFKFGRNRIGDIDQLKKYFNIKTTVIDSKYKTSQVKSFLINGNIDRANKLLFSPYTITGKVKHGKHLGFKLGYRTANVSLPNMIIQPKEGSYSGYTYVGSKKYKSAVFIRNRLVETHIFNFDKNIYGQTISIELVKYHKPFLKTNSFNELKNTINKKVKDIKLTF